MSLVKQTMQFHGVSIHITLYSNIIKTKFRAVFVVGSRPCGSIGLTYILVFCV